MSSEVAIEGRSKVEAYGISSSTHRTSDTYQEPTFSKSALTQHPRWGYLKHSEHFLPLINSPFKSGFIMVYCIYPKHELPSKAT